MPETPQEAYDRGAIAGEIAARLAGHDEHFATINGSLERIAGEMHAMALAVQRLADQAVADGATRVSTAAAVEKARKEAAEALESERVVRRERSETAWTPIVRVMAGVTGLAALAALIGWIKALSGK